MNGLLKLRNMAVSILTFGTIWVGITTLASAEKHVVYLRLSDYSGPIAGIDIPQATGTKYYFQYINDQGGIDGVKIKLIAPDVRYNVARAVSAYNRYRKEKKLLLCVGGGTGIAKAVGRVARGDKIVLAYPADGEIQGRQTPFTVACNCAYQDMFAGTIDWIMEDWKKKGNDTPPVIGCIGWDNPFGKEPLHGGMEYAQKKRVKMLQPEFFPVSALDFSVYLNRLAKGGAKYIIITAVDPSPTNVIVHAHRLGLTKDILFMSPFNWSHIENVGMKTHPEELEGTITGANFVRGEDRLKHPLKKIWTKYSGGKPFEKMAGGFFNGMGYAMSFVEAVKIGLKEVGYDKLNGEVLYKSYHKLGQPEYRDHYQGIAGPCTYSPTNKRPLMHMKLYQAKKGKLIPITDWRKLPDAVSLYNWK